MIDPDRLEILEPPDFLEHRSQPRIGAKMLEHRVGDVTQDIIRLAANGRVGMGDFLGSVLIELPRRAVPERGAPYSVRPLLVAVTQDIVPAGSLEYRIVAAHHQDIAVTRHRENMALHGEQVIRPRYMRDFVFFFLGIVVVAVEKDGDVTDARILDTSR